MGCVANQHRHIKGYKPVPRIEAQALGAKGVVLPRLITAATGG